jgi:fibronectin-binding autotransporter adhesin
MSRRFASFSSVSVPLLACAAALLLTLSSARANGGSAIWSSTPDTGAWIPASSKTNWSTGQGLYPGSTTGITNTDIATFTSSNKTTISITSPTLNIGSIAFDLAAAAYTFSPNSSGDGFLLSNGGSIQFKSTVTSASKTETFNVPIVLEPGSATAAGTYSFINNAPSTDLFSFNGAISGGTTSSSVTLTLDGSNTGINTISGNITNGGATNGVAIVKSGGGTWVLSGSNGYTGGTTVSQGLLQLNSSNALGSSSGSLTVNGGVLNLNGQNVGVGNLTGSGGNIWNNGPSGQVTFTIGNGNNGGGTYAGVIANNNGAGIGTVALTKTGSGTITLSGANTYTGATTVNGGGSLFINGNQSAATGAVTVSGNGTTLGGNGNIGGSVTINSGSTSNNNLSPGASGLGSIGKLTVGGLTLSANSTLNIDIGAGGNNTGTGGGTIYDQVVSNGNVALNNAALSISTSIGNLAVGNKYFIVENSTANPDVYGIFATGVTVTDNNGDIFSINYADNGDAGLIANDISLTVVTVVPEPSTWFAAALSFCAIGYSQRKRFSRTRKRGAKCTMSGA